MSDRCGIVWRIGVERTAIMNGVSTIINGLAHGGSNRNADEMESWNDAGRHGTAVEAIAPPTAKTIGAAAEPQNQGDVLRWQRARTS